jgi:hypothetical protein
LIEKTNKKLEHPKQYTVMPAPPPPPPPPPMFGGPPPPPPPMFSAPTAPSMVIKAAPVVDANARNDVLKAISDPSAGLSRLKKVDRSQIKDCSAPLIAKNIASSKIYSFSNKTQKPLVRLGSFAMNAGSDAVSFLHYFLIL